MRLAATGAGVVPKLAHGWWTEQPSKPFRLPLAVAGCSWDGPAGVRGGGRVDGRRLCYLLSLGLESKHARRSGVEAKEEEEMERGGGRQWRPFWQSAEYWGRPRLQFLVVGRQCTPVTVSACCPLQGWRRSEVARWLVAAPKAVLNDAISSDPAFNRAVFHLWVRT